MNMNCRKVLSVIMIGILFAGTQALANTYGRSNSTYIYNNIPMKQPVVTQSMKPGVQKYNSGNFLGAMVDFKEVVEKEPNNTYAKYYLALCCVQLGYKNEADQLFQNIIDSHTSYPLAFYSNRAKNCIGDNSKSEACAPPKRYTAAQMEEEESVGADGDASAAAKDDMTKFIESGKRIHPAAMDKITNERMERKIQADLYAQRQAEAENGVQQ